MGRIEQITKRSENMMRMLAIWESAVKATHTFLGEADIHSIQPEVQKGITAVQYLYGVFDDTGLLQGFMGVDNQKIEMLFIDADTRGQGMGKQLILFALSHLDARYVDVNEQNGPGVGFYHHMGFVVASRSAFDGQGRPFPILHLVHG